ncbi:O-antigen ligase family protein [Microbacterium azadirachtae]|uniref:O-antigen ligase-related domain-containing protein n=1 Tax=Microbacterium azadirachtae TaxID=582680 RepID=A0A0F0LQC4_9MICO|nr:O-antigen ligase family protein [Microbacterium azadirachtae]KJL34475.1 hypothetical protein RS86_00961 [Microbacterium azadirachtae]
MSSFTAYAVILFVYGFLHLRRRPPVGLRRVIVIFCLPVLVISLVTLMTNFGAPYIFGNSVVVSGGILIVLGMVSLPATKETIRAVLAGWLLASLSTTALAAIELSTGLHFGSTYLDANPGATKTGVVTVFFNPNNYAAFLTITIPLLLAGAALTTRTWVRRIYYLAALVSAPIMILTSSRFGLAALILGVSIWIVLRIRSHIGQAIVLAFAVLGAIFTLVFLQGRSAGEISGAGAGGGYIIGVLGFQIPVDSSFLARWNLSLNGLDMLAQTPLGSGPGGYELTAIAQGTSRQTFNMINPHNGAMEFFTEYGVILGALAFIVTIALFIGAIRANGTSSRSRAERSLATATISVIVMLPLVFVMHSTFINIPHEWIGFATFVVIGIHLSGARPTVKEGEATP